MENIANSNLKESGNFSNAGGGVPSPSSSSGTGDLIGMGVQVITSLVAGSISAKKNRELQEKLAKLSLDQQKELQEKMMASSSETERLAIMYQTFAGIEGQKLNDSRKNKQLIALSVFGGGILVLVGMSIIFKRKIK